MFELNIKESKALEHGIDVHRLLAGTIILAITKNTLYKLIKTRDSSTVIAQGGTHFLKPTEVTFSGSSFGGSWLKMGWIGYCMCMEMYDPSVKRRLKTSGVRAARIIGRGWEYEMEWEHMGGRKIIWDK